MLSEMLGTEKYFWSFWHYVFCHNYKRKGEGGGKGPKDPSPEEDLIQILGLVVCPRTL